VTIGLVDYGAGNLSSVAKGLSVAGADVVIARRPDDVTDVRGIVIPGVGHFAATAALDDRWRSRIAMSVQGGTPVLGICLGMQWLFEGSDEAPSVPGFGLFAGRCFRITGPIKVPHVGWNTLALTSSGSRLLEGVPDQAWAYFTHSFAAPSGDGSVATTTYGVPFAACIERDHVWGTQWHPEKSGDTGLRVLRNFMEFIHHVGHAGHVELQIE
jgi:glutamine amidotransferase